jgi:hypothetical protein
MGVGEERVVVQESHNESRHFVQLIYTNVKKKNKKEQTHKEQKSQNQMAKM